MRRIVFSGLLLFNFFVQPFAQTLFDSFTDGDFTASPVWGGSTSNWTVVANSDVAAGATGSNTVRLSAPPVSQTEYLSSQITNWYTEQEWGFWIGRRGQGYTALNQAYFWLYANEANLTSATVDGYRLAIGDDSFNDEIRLEYIVNGAVSTTVFTSSGSITNSLNDIGFLVRVTRTSSGLWTLYTSALPTSSGSGAIASDIPNSTNASILQGSGTENSLPPATNGYIGFAALHSTGANAIISTEFDQIYFNQLVTNTITTGTVSSPPFVLANCAATASGTVAFTSVGIFNAGNTFTAELSDNSGSFALPVVIGSTSLSGTNPGGTINIVIPAGTAGGTGYMIRIVSGDPATTGTPSSSFTITQVSYCSSNATDYFRSAATGPWANLSTWESSNDSTNWIPATLIPGSNAAHVVIRSPDSVYQTNDRTTKNLTILSGAVFNANSFTMTASLRFNLLGNASFYQGGTVNPVPGVEQVLSVNSNYHYNGTQAGISAALPEFGNLYWEPTPTGNNTMQNTIAVSPFNNGLVVRGNMTVNIQGPIPREIRFGTGTTVSRTHTIEGNFNIISNSSVVVVQNGGIGSTTVGTLIVGGDINITAGVFQGLSSSTLNDGMGVVILYGNLNNSGGVIQTGVGIGTYSFHFEGMGSVTANPGSGNSFHNVNVDGGKTVTLINNDFNIVSNKVLTLSPNSYFVLGNNNLIVDNLVAGSSSTSYVRTNGTGVLRLNSIGAAGKTFPVGHSQYNPILIENGSNHNWSVNVNDGVIADPPRGVTGAVSLTWNISPSVNPPVAGADITFQFDKINQVGVNFNTPPYNTPDNVQAWHRTQGYWLAAGTPTPLNLVAGNIWNVKVTGLTQFSPYALSRISLPLPVKLTEFSANKVSSGSAIVNWILESYCFPSIIFEIEKSYNGIDFSSIGSLPGNENSRYYFYNDTRLAKGTNWYRLKITEVDGKITYSKVVAIINDTKGLMITSVYPNPVSNAATVTLSAAKSGVADLQVYDISGTVVYRRRSAIAEGTNSLPLDLGKLPAGVYHLSVQSAESKAVYRLIKQ